MPAGAAPCDVIVELEIVAWLSVASIDRDCSISLKAAGAVRVGTRGGAGNSAGGGPARTARLARLSAPPMDGADQGWHFAHAAASLHSELE